MDSPVAGSSSSHNSLQSSSSSLPGEAVVFAVLGVSLTSDSSWSAQMSPFPLFLDFSANDGLVDTSVDVIFASAFMGPVSANSSESSGENPLPFVRLSLTPVPSSLTETVLWLGSTG